MPRYDFKCKVCGEIQEDVILSILHNDSDKPMCCGQRTQTHITVPPMVHWVDPIIEPFRSVADKNKTVITTTKQRREYMARNHLVDSNDLGTPPTKKEQMEYHENVVVPSVAAMTPTEKQVREMKAAGISDTVDDRVG